MSLFFAQASNRIFRTVTVSDAATITPDADSYDVVTVVLGGNRNIAAPTGTPYDGQKLIWVLIQDGPGSRIPVWNAAYRFSGGTAQVLTTTGGKTDYLGFHWNATASKWDCIAVALNL